MKNCAHFSKVLENPNFLYRNIVNFNLKKKDRAFLPFMDTRFTNHIQVTDVKNDKRFKSFFQSDLEKLRNDEFKKTFSISENI